jgi:putrescine transport system permease protein
MILERLSRSDSKAAGVSRASGASGIGTIAPPYAWLALFLLVPFVLVFKISLADLKFGIPPYTALTEIKDEAINLTVHLRGYILLFSDSLYISTYISSLKMAAVTTFWCALIGYPMAYYIARSPDSIRHILLLAVILPFWTSLLLRVYAWVGILRSDGLLNSVLISLGVIDTPLEIYRTDLAVYIGLVYAYLPFFILPLYANLVKLDTRLLDAAYDLGAKPWRAFLSITLPLSMPGVIAGAMLVFIPAVGEYVIPELLGGADTLMMGRVMWNEFFTNADWPMASAITVIMVLLLLVPMIVFQVNQKHRYEADRGRA